MGDKIAAYIEKALGQTSKWSGEITIDSVKGADYWGVKRWSCAIGLRDDIVDVMSDRFPTLIHEMFHSMSPALNPADYIANKGWEEGSVELAQRVYRKEIMSKQFPDFAVDDATFARNDKYNAYRIWVQDIESLARELKIPIKRFVRDLFKRTVAARSDYVKALGDAKFPPGSPGRDRWVKGFEKIDRELKLKDAPLFTP